MSKTLNEIRNTFIDHFVKHGHTHVESSPLVPRNDPTLMFTSAGMVQFKNLFTGQEKRGYTRATTSQKCLRAGGKHNDLENVGYTARHCTFFEMLGNFSFGDYFKKEAIPFAWELVTKGFGLPKDKLLVTVYHTDDEAADIWKKVAGFSDDKIIRIPTSDNFWSAGDVGPCGPCTEIFIDRGEHIFGGPPGSKDEDGDRFLEFWNLVFMQYEQLPGGERVNLPKPSIDTGMGLERMATIMQGVDTVFDTDLFANIIRAAEENIKVKYAGEQKPSYRVIADHLRAMTFMIADGILPSNEGRGYVLRRIMRRAMRHAHLLGMKDPVLYKLVPELQKAMGDTYPEIVRANALITETIKLEENRFGDTLGRGIKLLEEETGKLAGSAALPGAVAFRLYDTYGFPLDLTQDILRAQNRTVDTAGFEASMAEQKAKARAAWSGSGEAATSKIWFDIAEETGATDFLGYSTTEAEGVVTALVKDGARVKEANAGDKVLVVCNQTPFYGESGGQVGDTGTIKTAAAALDISDTHKQLGKVFIHDAVVKSGSIKVGDSVQMVVDHQRRDRIRANHSATHLLHEALRRVLGEHVSQKGSEVSAERLRFDISHPKAVTPEEAAKIEAIVNERILANSEVSTQLMTPDAAIKAGAMALFGEKYGEEVRVLSMGGVEDAGKHYSVELCGGTHAKRTGDIGVFKITGESAVAAGVRRIEAVTGFGAKELWDAEHNALQAASQSLRVPVSELPARVDALMDERKKLEKEITELRKKVALGGGSAKSNDDVQTINGIKLIARDVGELPARDLKPMTDTLKAQIGSGVVALAAQFEGKASLVVAVTPDLVGTLNAVDLVNAGATALGGKGGGGRPDLAQAGGPDVGALGAALQAIQSLVGKGKAA